MIDSMSLRSDSAVALAVLLTQYILNIVAFGMWTGSWAAALFLFTLPASILVVKDYLRDNS